MLTLSFRMMVVRTKDRTFLSDPSERPLSFVVHANNPSVFLKWQPHWENEIRGVKNNNNCKKPFKAQHRNSRNSIILFELLATILKRCFA